MKIKNLFNIISKSFIKDEKKIEVIKFGSEFGHRSIVRVYEGDKYRDFSLVPFRRDREDFSTLNKWVSLSGDGQWEYEEDYIGNFYYANYKIHIDTLQTVKEYHA